MAKMAIPSSNCITILLFCLLGIAATASSVSLSEGIFESQGAPGRALLQAKKSCTVDFENQNYTIVTSQCKGPQYLPKFCCEALKKFACPFADQINDLTNDCATTMFSYINLYGKYPPGLFANECKETKDGLDCGEEDTSGKSSVNSGDAPRLKTQAIWVMAGSLVALVFQLLL